MSWSAQQEQAIAAVKVWLADKKGQQVFRLFGYAGVGKTTLAKEIAQQAAGKVLFACFTGKAALVLRSKGCANASTIHSLIYKPTEDERGITKFILNTDSELAMAKLLVVDEVSMVGPEIGRDLLSFGVRILVLGDPAQLPPISGTGFFTEQAPDVMLTEIHRQAADNPIIRLSMEVREGRALALGRYGESKIITRAELDQGDVLKADQVIVGLNRTRKAYNARMRWLFGHSGDVPLVGERVICLRNNREKGLLNGGIWNVLKAANDNAAGKKTTVSMTVKSEDTPNNVEAVVPIEFFKGTEDTLDKFYRRNNDEFTWGYAITCHKAQGSQFSETVVFDESFVFREDARRWLYTAITRAAERITVVA